jgi:hypothetical protein
MGAARSLRLEGPAAAAAAAALAWHVSGAGMSCMLSQLLQCSAVSTGAAVAAAAAAAAAVEVLWAVRRVTRCVLLQMVMALKGAQKANDSPVGSKTSTKAC